MNDSVKKGETDKSIEQEADKYVNVKVPLRIKDYQPHAKRVHAAYVAGRKAGLERERELEEALKELVRCNPVWKENLLSSDVTLSGFTNALEKAKQLLKP